MSRGLGDVYKRQEALVELVDKIYVYPEQKIDIYFKFASVESSPDRILEKDGVI